MNQLYPISILQFFFVSFPCFFFKNRIVTRMKNAIESSSIKVYYNYIFPQSQDMQLNYKVVYIHNADDIAN